MALRAPTTADDVKLRCSSCARPVRVVHFETLQASDEALAVTRCCAERLYLIDGEALLAGRELQGADVRELPIAEVVSYLADTHALMMHLEKHRQRLDSRRGALELVLAQRR